MDKRPTFGDLKSGDRFIWYGVEYEKISGNMAVRLHDDKIFEVLSNEIIIVTEVY